MKLTQFALAAIVVLLAVAGYLTIKSDLDSRLEAQNALNEKMLARMEDIAAKQATPPPLAVPSVAPIAPAPAAVAAPVPAPSMDPAAKAAIAVANNIPPGTPMAAEDDPRMMEDERKILSATSSDREALDSPLPAPALGEAPMNNIQRRIAALPPIAAVKEYAAKEGVLVLNRGSNAKLQPGDTFALRRGTAIIGRIRVSETIEATESVADVLPNSMVVGMTPAVGDEAIQFD